jgi:hypothetical protein
MLGIFFCTVPSYPHIYRLIKTKIPQRSWYRNRRSMAPGSEEGLHSPSNQVVQSPTDQELRLSTNPLTCPGNVSYHSQVLRSRLEQREIYFSLWLTHGKWENELEGGREIMQSPVIQAGIQRALVAP